jgi:hypothetical protein
MERLRHGWRMALWRRNGPDLITERKCSRRQVVEASLGFAREAFGECCYSSVWESDWELSLETVCEVSLLRR